MRLVDAVFVVKAGPLAEFRRIDDPVAVAEAVVDRPFHDVAFDVVPLRAVA